MTDPEPAAVRIERTFAAPIELVWRLWTEPQLFATWYGPDGAAVTVAEMDVRVGGRRLVRMEMNTPDGPRRMCFTGEYREVEERRRLVYTDAIADEDGNVLPPEAVGMPADHPTTTEVTVELENLGDRTRMRMVHAGVPEGSPGAAGWTMAFAKLTAAIEAVDAG